MPTGHSNAFDPLMDPPPDHDFSRLIGLASASSRALRAAGVPPESPALPGWLVLQRLDRTEIAHASASNDRPRREETFYEQIWLTVDGELRQARRTHIQQRGGGADGPSGGVVPDSDATRPGAVIATFEDVSGSRWDGAYGPSSQRDGSIETIVHDEPCGPRENPATRIERALERMTAWLIEGADPPAAVTARTGLATVLAMSVGMVVGLVVVLAGTAVAAFMLYAWFMGAAAGSG